MAGNMIAILVAASLGQFPPAGPAQPPGGGPGTSQYGPGAVMAAPDSTQALNTGDPLYRYDYEPNWVHGYYQEIPAYGGYHFFRPYNYKNVMPQSQVSAAWGNAANMPYSHQYFDRVSGNQTVWNSMPRSNVARSNDELKAQLAEVDGVPRRTRRRSQQQQFVQSRQGQNVMPAGHQEN
ncbi:MAG: hypothetical protein V4719_20865 [Planctomycetota bacterium]